MSRPKPNVLIEHTDKATYKTEQVLASEGVWAVFYDNKPINLKTSNMLTQYPGPKYKKVSFSNPGHAKNLARKLNTQFKTDKFTVVLLTQGAQVYPDAKKTTTDSSIGRSVGSMDRGRSHDGMVATS
jgi:hypothetical protein